MRGPTILLYHRIGEERFDPWAMTVSSENFADQMNFIAWLDEWTGTPALESNGSVFGSVSRFLAHVSGRDRDRSPLNAFMQPL